jgi:hypothetical protein
LKVIHTIANVIVAHENDMLLHIIIMVSTKVEVSIRNKMLKTIKASKIRASTTHFQSKVEQYCDRIYKCNKFLWVAKLVSSMHKEACWCKLVLLTDYRPLNAISL